MDKRHKDLLRRTVGELRRTLAGGEDSRGDWQRGDLDRELERLGIAPDGARTPLSALPGLTDDERRAHEAALAAMADVPAERLVAARAEVVERAAYTWINRLLALRAMESRGLIEETLRANPAYSGSPEALFVLRQTAPARCSGPDGGWWAVIEDACASQAEDLPGLFDLADPVAALRPSTAGLQRCILLVGGAPAGFGLDEGDAVFADPDAIGWAYQFYQEDAKKRTYAKLGAGGKASTRADIAAVTQLFTEPYMVKWLLQNSLGRSYHELYPDSKLPDVWEYYIRELPNDEPPPRCATSLAGLTFMDPCCGSGHFEREAFDMLAAMYREEEPSLSAAEIADRIFTRHLHGIDIDPRAVQLTALTLYLRARELVAAERRAARQPGPGAYRPPIMRLAATPTGLPTGALERHLARHPDDQVVAPFLEGIFHALENADILGSLLRPSEDLQKAIAALAATGTLAMDFDPAAMALRQAITTRAGSDPEGLGRDLLDRIAATFAAEAGAGQDVAAALFGHEAAEGVRLLRLLGERYAVVGTNPPYLGSSNMGSGLRRFVESHYTPGKRDLYAAFIMRCLELCMPNGRAALITLHTFLSAVSFVDLRKLMLQLSSLDECVHLGTGTMKSLSNPNAQGFCMYVLSANGGSASDRLGRFIRLVDSREKEGDLLRLLEVPRLAQSRIILCSSSTFTEMPDFQFSYWMPTGVAGLFRSPKTLGQVTSILQGLATADDNRCLRFFWEIPSRYAFGEAARFAPITKGGGRNRWAGLDLYFCEWQFAGARIRARSEPRLQNEHGFGLPFYTYSRIANGFCGTRRPWTARLLGDKGPGIIPIEAWNSGVEASGAGCQLQSLLQSRVATYLLRAIGQNLAIEVNSLLALPLPGDVAAIPLNQPWLDIKCAIVAESPVECSFDFQASIRHSIEHTASMRLVPLLLSGEAWIELRIADAYGVNPTDWEAILAETGTPAGFHPLVAAYDTLPDLPPDLDLPPLPREVLDYLDAHVRIHPTLAELARVKARLRALYEAGPGAKNVAGGEADEAGDGAEDGDEGEVVAGAYIPIPTETFLEELSVKMQLHPNSVYWLLEELRAEGARCKPEELRLLEDRLSVLMLRLLGHRWPRQVEAGEAVPEWADDDGIIPVTAGAGEPTLADRLRERLRAEDGDLGAQRTEAQLAELTGLALDEWVRRQFYPRHMRQFKQRPIAWHLASRPGAAVGKKAAGRRLPAFECFMYYHAGGLEALGRIRTLYVEPLLRADRQRLADARQSGDDGAAAAIYERVNELEDFNNRLRQVEETAFACPELDAFLAKEPLDRWCGDGYVPPAGAEAFAAQERAWRVDINDGVRVNIAPVQQAGLLAADLLKPKDAAKAIADRARWRADERRWVRDGKLPRCGWMPEGVPESPRWTERAPEREAERAKLEEKRRKVREAMGQGGETKGGGLP